MYFTSMKRLLLAFALLLSLLADAQVVPLGVSLFKKDSMPYRMRKHWRFHPGDSAAWAVPSFNDSSWAYTDPELRVPHQVQPTPDIFSSIGWFRLTFFVDTSLVNTPLALSITQYGASEFYLDGKKVAAFGVINGKDSSEYFDPQSRPAVITVQHTGPHVLAVRYANYDAAKTLRRYNKDFAGFRMELGMANRTIANYTSQTFFVATLMMFMFGLFIAMSLTHLFLFLYYRAGISNLYFSIFCLCLALLFLILYLNHFSASPTTQLNGVYFTLAITALSCLSFSGLCNSLFSKGKLRFRIIAAICIVSPFLYPVGPFVAAGCLFVMVGVVSLEAIVLIIRAIIRKVKGVRIVGAGILLLSVFFLIVVVWALSSGDIEISDANPAGQVLEVVGLLAIMSLPFSLSAYLAWSFAEVNRDLKKQLVHVEELSEKALEQEQEKKALLENRKEELEAEVAARTEEVVAQKQEIEQQHTALKIEKKKTDDLLLNILPEEIAEELKQKGTSEAKFFDHVTVLFTDFVNFTKAGERMSPQELVDELHACFKAFDNICSKYNIEKIKTIGDAYLAVCGLPVADVNHAVNVTNAALEILWFMKARRESRGDKTFEIRIGIHSGSVVAGIVGVKKFAYDIWGDTVNTAARMEQHSEAGKINASEATYELIKDNFACTPRGKITAKNKGEMNMYFVDERI